MVPILLQIHIFCIFFFTGYNDHYVLQDHIDRKHKGIREVCDECGKQFTRKSSLRLHMKVHENEPEKVHYGQTIQFYPDSDFEDLSNDPKFPSKSWDYFLYNVKEGNLKVLDTKTGQEKVVPNNAGHKCRFCGEMIKKGAFVPHLVKHDIGIEASEKGFGHKKDKERLRCQHCGKIFKKLPELRDHINTHTGERPHVCKYCGKTFASSGNMHAHIRQGHLGKKRNSSERKSHMNSSQESKALHQLPLPLGLENLSQMKNNTNTSTPQYRQVKPEILIP